MSIAISLTERSPSFFSSLENESLFKDARHYFKSENRRIDEFIMTSLVQMRNKKIDTLFIYTDAKYANSHLYLK